MALRFIDGFEHYAAADIARKWGGASPGGLSMVTGRDGGQALKVDASASDRTQLLTLAADTSGEVVFGFSYRLDTEPSSGNNTFIITGRPIAGNGSSHFYLNLEHDGTGDTDNATFQVYNSSAVLDSEHITTLILGTWYSIEIRLKIGNAGSGELQLWIDGTSLFSITSGADFQVSVNTQVREMRFGARNGAISSFDHLYVLDGSGSTNTARLGADARVKTLEPASDVTTDWTTVGSGATHAARVASADDDTTAVDSNTTTNVDRFGYDALSDAGATVHAVQHAITAKRVGTARSLKSQIVSDTSVNNATAVALGTAYAITRHIAPLDPDTSAAWTPAAVDALEAGMELTA